MLICNNINTCMMLNVVDIYSTLYSVVSAFVLSSSCGTSVEEGKSCVLTCATGSAPAARQTPITWIRDSVPSNSVNRSPCVNPGGYLADYTVSCSGTDYFLTITAAVYGRDNVEWKCDYNFGGVESRPLVLSVTGKLVL